LNLLLEQQLAEKAQSLLESLTSKAEDEAQMQTENEEEDAKKLELVGAILKL